MGGTGVTMTAGNAPGLRCPYGTILHFTNSIKDATDPS